MSNAPYLLAKARGGYRVGHDRIFDHMMLDGLEDAYEPGAPMGDFGEARSQAYQFTRADQDAYAGRDPDPRAQGDRRGRLQGRDRAGHGPGEGRRRSWSRTTNIRCKVSPEKIPALKPAFRADGTITAASASANADGAAALILTTRSRAERDGLPILAEIKAHATHCQEPAWYTTAPIPAIRKVLDKTGWSVGDVDLFEINEAFAVVAMAAARGSRHPAREAQHPWRRLRAGPSDRRHGCAAHRDLAACAAALWAEARRRVAVHRRRRGHRDRDRTGLGSSHQRPLRRFQA